MASVNMENPSKLDSIHIRRMFHAFYLVCLKLRSLNSQDVNDILDAYQITLLPGLRVGLEYGNEDLQILRYDLQAEHFRLDNPQPNRQKKVKTKKKNKK